MKKLLSLLSLVFCLSAFGAGSPYVLNYGGIGTNGTYYWLGAAPTQFWYLEQPDATHIYFRYRSGAISSIWYTFTDEFHFSAGPFLDTAAPNSFASWDVDSRLGSTFDGNSLTNLHYAFTTNAVNTGVYAFGNKAYQTNTTANVTLGAFDSVDPALYESFIIYVNVSGGTDRTVTMPNGVVGPPGYGTPAVFYCTNGVLTKIIVDHYGRQNTNAYKIDIAP